MEAEIDQSLGGWVYGKFRMWAAERPIGDWDDAADMRGVSRWIRDLVENPRDRRDVRLDKASNEEVFRLVFDPVMAGGKAAEIIPPIEDAFSRFHISHIRMSSFETYDVLLLERADRRQRLLWRHKNGPIQDVVLWPGEVERVAREMSQRLDVELARV